MNAIILPIKKTFSDRIFAGAKKCEYRKSLPKREVNKILVYESQGVGAVVGEFEVSGLVFGKIVDLWNTTNEYSDTTKAEFDAYYANKETGVAYKIKNPVRYEKPIPITEFGLKAAPQSFAYVRS